LSFLCLRDFDGYGRSHPPTRQPGTTMPYKCNPRRMPQHHRKSCVAAPASTDPTATASRGGAPHSPATCVRHIDTAKCCGAAMKCKQRRTEQTVSYVPNRRTCARGAAAACRRRAEQASAMAVAAVEMAAAAVRSWSGGCGYGAASWTAAGCGLMADGGVAAPR